MVVSVERLVTAVTAEDGNDVRAGETATTPERKYGRQLFEQRKTSGQKGMLLHHIF